MVLEVKFITNTVRGLEGKNWKYTVICEIMEYFGLECDILKMRNLYYTIMVENEGITKFSGTPT